MNKQDKVDAALEKSQKDKQEADKKAMEARMNIFGTSKPKVDESDNDKVATPLPKDDAAKTKTTTSDPVGTVPKVEPPVDTTESTVPTSTATTPTVSTKLAQSGGYQMPSYNEYDAIY